MYINSIARALHKNSIISNRLEYFMLHAWIFLDKWNLKTNALRLHIRLEYTRHFIQWCDMQYARIFCSTKFISWRYFSERQNIQAISKISGLILIKPSNKEYIIPRLLIFAPLCSISASGLWNACCIIWKSYRCLPMLEKDENNTNLTFHA